jgi:hypothetical protein
MFNPQQQDSYITIDEVDLGVWFVTDQDGPVTDSACDAGPWSVQADARRELVAFQREINERIADVQVERHLGNIEAREWELNYV